MKKYFLRLGLLLTIIFAGVGGYFALDNYGYIDKLLYGFGWEKVNVYEENTRTIVREGDGLLEVEEKRVFRKNNKIQIKETKIFCDVSARECAVFMKSDGKWKHIGNVKLKSSPNQIKT